MSGAECPFTHSHAAPSTAAGLAPSAEWCVHCGVVGSLMRADARCTPKIREKKPPRLALNLTKIETITVPGEIDITLS
jgi:hypothetical protein